MSQEAQPPISSYQLSQAESSRILTTLILPLDIDPLPPSPTPDRPYALLALGQTGAGKTLLVPPLLASLRAHGRRPAHLIADVYKTHHPQYFSLPPRIASQACSRDARIWLEGAVAAACQRRLDVLIESACRHPSDFTALVQILNRAGYRITVVVLAVPYALSRLGVLVRYYEKLPESGSRGLGVRLTPNKVHDDSYHGLMKAAEWLDEEGLADGCVVLRRGGLVGFVNSRAEGGVAEALAKERERPLTEAEREVAREGLNILRGIPEAEAALAEVQALLEPLLSSEAGRHGSFPELKSLLGEDGRADDAVLGVNSIAPN